MRHWPGRGEAEAEAQWRCGRERKDQGGGEAGRSQTEASPGEEVEAR